MNSLDAYLNLDDETMTIEYSTDVIGTGTKVLVKQGDTVVNEFETVVFGDVDSSVRCSADQERIDTAGDFTGVTAVFVHEFTTGISDHVIAIRAINNRYIIFFHLNKSIEIRCKVSTFF